MCSHCCSEGEETDAILEANESLKTNPTAGRTALYGHSRQAGVSGCRSEPVDVASVPDSRDRSLADGQGFVREPCCTFWAS